MHVRYSDTRARRRTLGVMKAWIVALSLAVYGCLSARDAHDIARLSVDSIECIESQPEGMPPEQIAIACAVQDVPDIVRLIVDLLAQKRAAERVGVHWQPVHGDGGAP